MIYLPERAVFIHIPRTGGNSIKNAIASVCIGKDIPAVVSTMPTYIKEFDRVQGHQTASVLKGYIREWNDIYRFAVHRPIEDRFESMNNFIKMIKARPNHQVPEQLKDFMAIEDHLSYFKKEWSGHTTQFFTQGLYGEDLGVEVYNYEDLPDRWHEICDKCKIPRCDLPHLNKS
ncbi:MAG: hypothetical protein FI729_01375 [SAR202 cluster bacterium]|nr:hypothetical protein [SAR202 cluster bacterium]|tara:strand:- start:6993 stop:7514 length:522 start_codon:yes stop_codon:yes gene_type:complete